MTHVEALNLMQFTNIKTRNLLSLPTLQYMYIWNNKKKTHF